MRVLASLATGATIAGFFVVMHADTPWFAATPHETFSAAESRVTLNPGQSLVIATVPASKILTITDASAMTAWGGSWQDLEVDERDPTGADVVKIPEGLLGIGPAYGSGSQVAHGNGHGVVFGAGTNVVIKNDVNGTGPAIFSYLVIGYWTDK